MTTEPTPRVELDSLDCDHCGGHAITSTDNTFGDGDSDRCDDCGFPGTVVVDDSSEDEATAYWSCSDDPLDRCKRADCEECTELSRPVDLATPPAKDPK